MENVRDLTFNKNDYVTDVHDFHRAFWQSRDVLNGLTKDCFNNTSSKTKDLIHDEMWRNLTAEYDALHLSNRIRACKQKFSPEFLAFEHIWLLDENNHYEGLLQIYSAIFNFDEHEVHNKVSTRTPDFSEIEDFIENELLLCVCFAYDELASSRGYTEAFSLYDTFGLPALKKWIRLAARDELFHSLNARYILRVVHCDNIQKVPDMLRQIVQRDLSREGGYKATFLFDHDHDPINNPFSSDFLKACANEICSALSTPLAFQETI